MRSGRRVAAEDDLSMTEVPDKESEVPTARPWRPRARSHRRARGRPGGRRGRGANARPSHDGHRRRSGRAAGREAVQVAATAVTPEDVVSTMPMMSMPSCRTVAPDEPTASTRRGRAPSDGEGEVDGEGHRRRRRRRGGRGRGRGRGQDREVPTEAGVPSVASAAASTDRKTRRTRIWTPTRRLAHPGVDLRVGLGQPDRGAQRTARQRRPRRPDADDEDEDEPRSPSTCWPSGGSAPVVPAGVRRNPVAVEAGVRAVAVAPISRPSIVSDMDDRVAAPSVATAATATFPRSDAASTDRGPRYGSGSPRRSRRTDRPPTRTSSARQWRSLSEVPPELEEMLRAELARKGAAPRGAHRPRRPLALTPAEEPASTRRPAAAAATAESVTEVAPASGAEVARRRTPARKTAATEARPGRRRRRPWDVVAEAKPKRRAPARKTAATEAPAASAGDAPARPTPTAKPKRRTSTRKAPAEA